MDTTSFAKKTIGGVVQIEPALTPPPASSKPAFPVKPKLDAAKPRTKKRDIPEGLWTKCPSCNTMIFDKELDENLKVCPKCQHHFPIGSRERIHSLVETCSFEEMDAEMTSVDPLKFAGYKSKLERDRKNTMLRDAVVTGIGRMGVHRVALAVMDFGFMGGSMGSVVG
ncbi:MAG TPA: acetyl-CoA carboxylase carboxyl transferase subunit beta, partial [Verrucomicrobiae bacterium]